MPNITKRTNRDGSFSYKITVTKGRDANGKQIRHFMTFTPAPNMTEKKAEKEAQRVAFAFEKQIEDGFSLDNRQTFSNYAEYVIDLKERAGAKHRTIERYRQLMERINPAIGHIKLADIKPQHLNAFYKNLAEEGIRKGADRAQTKVDLPALLKKKGVTRAQVAALAGVAPMTVTTAAQGKKITLERARMISTALGYQVNKLFSIEKNTTPLSSKTITEYHRLISTVLAQADKEMLVLFNAAHKATPPKLERKEAETFQPEEVQKIRDCLEYEPIKWKTITHLLLITGCRRGEIMGLKWEDIEWDRNRLKIARSLLYSPARGVYEDTTKTGNIRRISLPSETMQLLKVYRAWYSELQLKNGDRWQNSGYLFVQDNGAPMNPDSLTDWLNKFSKRYGIPNVHPHKFRHTMASLLYFGGLDSITISKRLGHAKVSTTTDIYSHIIQQADEQAADKIAETIFRAGKKEIG